MGMRRKRRPSPVKEAERERESAEQQPGLTLQESMLAVLVLTGAALGFLYIMGVNTGPAGDFIARLFSWLFGLSSPLWFIYVFGQAGVALLGRKQRAAAPGRVAAAVLVLLVIQVYLHLRLPVNSWHGTTATGLALADELQPAAVRGGGGMIGGVLTYLLLRSFSFSGTLVVLAAALLAAAVLAWGPGLGRALVEYRPWKRPRQPGVEEVNGWASKTVVEEEVAAGASPLPAVEQRPEGPVELRRGGVPAEGARPGVSPAAGLRVPGVYTTPGEKEKAIFKPLVVRREGRPSYRLPALNLLQPPDPLKKPGRASELAEKLEQTLSDFGVKARVVQVDRGPVVTRFEVQPSPGVKVSRIVALADDIALALAAPDVRIEAPIPGKAAVGIEVPNQEPYLVRLREVLASPAFQATPARLALGLGVDIIGHPVVADLTVMPHLLIAGATGSGKSVCLNTMLISLLYRATPDELKLVLIDPKRVELTKYEGIPHLAAPVVTDPKRAAVALRWIVEEMGERYNRFSRLGVRNIERYNELVRKTGAKDPRAEGGEGGGAAEELEPLPYLVVFIDELSDLMLVAAAEVEYAIFRLAQMARAAGIHLVLATQRPSVDVLTGVIKANIPSRIAFAVSSQTDSRTILDTGGAERLLGRGDMLFLPLGSSKPLRLQGAFVSDQEVERVVQFWRQQAEPEYDRTDFEVEEVPLEEEEDELFDQAVRVVVESGQASASFLQRRLRVGYARAARLLEQLEQRGVVGPAQGSKPREVLIGRGELPRS